MTDFFTDLKNGVVLAELGGYGDGPYCARQGAGAALVLLGTYIVDAGDDVPYPRGFVFKPGQYQGYLREHVAIARGGAERVGVSVICVNPRYDIDFLLAAQQAGADYLSLCLHSVMPMFVERGLSSAMLRREQWPRLREHLAAILQAVERPFIAKVQASDAPDSLEAVEQIVGAGVRIVHANLGRAASPGGLALTRKLHGMCPVLIAGGGICSVEDAHAVIAAGADAVAIGTAAMNDNLLCGRVQAALRAKNAL